MILGLQLNTFRSYQDLDLSVPHVPLVFLVGPNGAGKTNLLEAASILGGGRGLRGALARDLTRQGHSGDPAWVVRAQVSRAPLRHAITHALGAEGRLARLDQKTVTGTQLAALLPTLSLTPDDEGLFRGPAEGRRGLLDKFVSAMAPDHRNQVGAYGRALRQRNALIRQAGQTGQAPDPAWMQGLERQMASHGVALAHQRRVFLTMLATAVADDVGPFPAARLGLEGAMEADLETQSPGEVEDTWADKWASERPQDLAAGRTLKGPHRSDLWVIYDEKDRPASKCSTGEQKALLLSLFLGQTRLLQAQGRQPLLLMDEVAAHLDADRRQALLRELAALRAQTWISGTDATPLTTGQNNGTYAVIRLRDSRLDG